MVKAIIGALVQNSDTVPLNVNSQTEEHSYYFFTQYGVDLSLKCYNTENDTESIYCFVTGKRIFSGKPGEYWKQKNRTCSYIYVQQNLEKC